MLFWGNAIALLFLLLYRRQSRFAKERQLSVLLIMARLCHAFYYFVAFGRGTLPDWLSASAGVTVLFIGYYFEAQAILRVIKEPSKFGDRLLRAMLAAAVIFFYAVELSAGTGGLRVTTASLGVVALMAFPVIRMFFSHDSGAFTKSVALLYGVFLLQLLGRAWLGLQDHSFNILTTNVLQSLTFLTLLLQHIIALPAYSLIIKDSADEALLLMATTDRLTGATNRHAFLDAATAIHQSSRIFQHSLSVLFIDIDHFKQVNDQYGHAFGDIVLTRLATLIDKCLRTSDLSCRYGGEEFIALLSHAKGPAAQIVAQRILDEVRQARFEEHPDFAFTVSIGVFSGVPSAHQTFDAAVSLADGAMYQAKRAGRNQVVFCDEAVLNP
ncbi:MAG: GGDEF domain-containing protein [Candidatus Adiutrix sp.]|nr:GGDEF domain-containing protein [Candidatus Adiutrix sp.]